MLASAEQDMVIGDSESALIMRFHPEEYMDMMLDKMNEIAEGSKTNVDFVPRVYVRDQG